MRAVDVALKDLKQSSRSLSIYFFMFGVPILVTLLFFLIFGGLGADDGGFELPRSTVLIVNFDQGRLPDTMRGSVAGIEGSAEATSMGELLAIVLGSDVFADLMEVSSIDDEAAARSAVDGQEADVAVIIPAGFTAAVMEQGSSGVIQLYKDPSLTIGPAIVESIVRQVVDGIASGGIGANAAIEGLEDAGLQPTPGLVQEIVDSVTTFGSEGRDPMALVSMQAMAGDDEPTDMVTEIVSVILAGMMVFFAFYAAAGAVESILLEEERGTLARLFTTPTPPLTILRGKALAAVVTVVVQITTLMIFGNFVFGIRWGEPIPLLLAAAGIVTITASTGIFLVSLLQTTRQGGIIFGGLLTLTGTMGMMPAFTSGVPNQPEAIKTAALFVPQGWAIRGLTTAMDGGGVVDILPTLGVLLIWSLVFLVIGQRRLQRRFA